jgi:hypothetical protein
MRDAKPTARTWRAGCPPAVRVTAAAAVVAAVVVASAAVHGSEQRPFPAFEAVSLEGTAVPSASIVRAGRWLLVYVTPDSPASLRLLRAMAAWNLPAARQVVVVGAAAGDASAWRASLGPDAPQVRWVADPQRSAWQALRITGTPGVFGLEAGQLKWELAGVLNDPGAVEPAVREWLSASPE